MYQIASSFILMQFEIRAPGRFVLIGKRAPGRFERFYRVAARRQPAAGDPSCSKIDELTFWNIISRVKCTLVKKFYKNNNCIFFFLSFTKKWKYRWKSCYIPAQLHFHILQRRTPKNFWTSNVMRTWSSLSKTKEWRNTIELEFWWAAKGPPRLPWTFNLYPFFFMVVIQIPKSRQFSRKIYIMKVSKC